MEGLYPDSGEALLLPYLKVKFKTSRIYFFLYEFLVKVHKTELWLTGSVDSRLGYPVQEIDDRSQSMAIHNNLFYSNDIDNR